MAKEKKSTVKSKAFDYKTIDSFIKVCEKLNVDPNAGPDVSNCIEKFKEPIKALYKTMLWYEAVNDGWVPEMGNSNQAKYYPWPWVLSSGSGFSDSDYLCDHSITAVGSFLCTKDSERALWVFEHAKDLFKIWMLGLPK